MFPKLKVDTRTSRPQPSHFASLKPQSHAPPPDDSWENGPSTAPLADGAPRPPNGDVPEGGEPEKATAAIPVTRSRGPSISFNPQVTTDSGHLLAIEEPLPRAHSLRSSDLDGEVLWEEPVALHTDAIPIASAPPRTQTEPGGHPYHGTTGLPLDRRGERGLAYRTRESRPALLLPRGDELGRAERHAGEQLQLGRERDWARAHERQMDGRPSTDPVASLTSETTASSLVEEASTPLDPPPAYFTSPLPTSPIELSWSGRRTHSSSLSTSRSQRTRSLRSDRSASGSLRRRRTTRSGSGTPSMSPASAFLSQWSKDDGSAHLPEPDDEGQEIGDHSEYIIGRQIGFGGFSVVKEVVTLSPSGAKVRQAVKIVRKHILNKSEHENERVQQDFEREVSIWRYLRHRHILRLLVVYNSTFATFCITPLSDGGTLFDLVRATRKTQQHEHPSSDQPPRRRPFLHPARVRRYAAQLASALRYLHEDARVVHRDVKLENCLLDTSSSPAADDDDSGRILLCDFGMADFTTNEHRASPPPPSTSPPPRDYLPPTRTASMPALAPPLLIPPPGRRPGLGPTRASGPVFVDAAGGSLAYASPERLAAPASHPLYSPAVDLWAFGVVVHALGAGSLPFAHNFEPRLAEKIARGEWDVAALRMAVAGWGEDGDRDREGSGSGSGGSSSRSSDRSDGDGGGEGEGVRLGPEAEAAVELVEGCLRLDPLQRWTIADVVESRWLGGTRELVEGDEEGAGGWLEE